jgi:hypothetical protein
MTGGVGVTQLGVLNFSGKKIPRILGKFNYLIIDQSLIGIDYKTLNQILGNYLQYRIHNYISLHRVFSQHL